MIAFPRRSLATRTWHTCNFYTFLRCAFTDVPDRRFLVGLRLPPTRLRADKWSFAYFREAETGAVCFMSAQISTVYSRGSWGSWRYLCNVTQLRSDRLSGGGGCATCAGDDEERRARSPNSCPLRIQPLCGRVAGSPYITYVVPGAGPLGPPFYVWNPCVYNAPLATERHRIRAGVVTGVRLGHSNSVPELLVV